MAFRYLFVSQGRAPEAVSPGSFVTMLASEGVHRIMGHALVALAEKNCRLQAANAKYEDAEKDVFSCEVIPGHFVEYKPEQVTPETHEQLELPVDKPKANRRYGSIDRMRAASGERDD